MKCLNCGRTFWKKRKWQKFCSDRCRIIYWKKIKGLCEDWDVELNIDNLNNIPKEIKEIAKRLPTRYKKGKIKVFITQYLPKLPNSIKTKLSIEEETNGILFLNTFPDIDHIIKKVFNTFSYIFWTTDSRIVKVEAEKIWGEKELINIKIKYLQPFFKKEKEKREIFGNFLWLKKYE